MNELDIVPAHKDLKPCREEKLWYWGPCVYKTIPSVGAEEAREVAGRLKTCLSPYPSHCHCLLHVILVISPHSLLQLFFRWWFLSFPECP